MDQTKVLNDAVQAMIEATIELRRLADQNKELLKETFELAGQNEKLLYQNSRLVVALKEALTFLTDWQGGRNFVLIDLVRQAIREAEND